MEDREIMNLYFARSEQAIAETERKYGAYLRKVVRNIRPCAEDGEEVVSDVYLAVWNSVPPNQPKVWKHFLARIARNLSFKRFAYLSAEKRSPDAQIMLSELDDCIPDCRKGVEETVETKELGAYVNRFLATKNGEDCGLFVSRYFYSMTTEQLAAKYGCSPRQIKYRLQKLRAGLKRYLQREGVWE